MSIVGNYILETMLTVDVETGEQSRVGVGLQTDYRHDKWSSTLERASWAALGLSAIDTKLREGEGTVS